MKNIIITGATGNLGKTVTSEFSSGDYHLNLAVRKPLENTDRQTAWYPDLTNAAAVDEMVRSIRQTQGAVDAAIHLVGGYKPGVLNETRTDDVTEMIGLNFNTAFNLVQALLPQFRENGRGVFIFIGASAAMKAVTAGYNVAYALSKQLLVPFAEMINEANRNENITAHVLLPTTLDTPLNRSLMPDADFSKWTSTSKIAGTMREIVDGIEKRQLIQF
jgi:NAD(P)-dependent dehydrogenase (short-subunit alcohol dehydrogenase family)